MKYRVYVTGLVETSEWYEVEAENEGEAEEKALEEAEVNGFEDPMVTTRPRAARQDKP